MSGPRDPINNRDTYEEQNGRSYGNNNLRGTQGQSQGRNYDPSELQWQPQPVKPKQPRPPSQQSEQRPFISGGQRGQGKRGRPRWKQNFNTYRYQSRGYRGHGSNRQHWSFRGNPTKSSNSEESNNGSTSNERRSTRAEILEKLDSDMETARLKAEAEKIEISAQATEDVENFKTDLTTEPSKDGHDPEERRTAIENIIWKGTTIAGPEADAEIYVKTSDLEIIVDALAGFLSELPQNAEPNNKEMYKGSRDKFLQKLVGLRQEQETIKLDAVNTRLGNLTTRSIIAELEYKILKNQNDIKSMGRNNCTKSQAHSIVRNEMEDGRVIILRRLFGKNLKTYLTWCSEKHNTRTQKVFNYLIEKKEYNLNCGEINEDPEQNRRDFWDRAKSILREAVPVELHRDIKLGGDTCDAKTFEGIEINTDVKLIFDDRRDARWVHNLYCNQLENGKALNKPPMIYEGREKERREDGIKTGKDYENEKWVAACKKTNERVITILKDARDLDNITKWIKSDEEICQKIPKISHLGEEEKRKGLDQIDSEFRIHEKEAPKEGTRTEGNREDEEKKEYALICRNSILHAIKLAARIEANATLMENGDYPDEFKKSIVTVMDAFKATTNLNNIKSFLGITRSANAVGE